jgi:hypothetical protein
MTEKTSHDTQLYTLGKGILKFDRWDDNGLPTGLRDIGNCSALNLTMVVEALKHYSERQGIQLKDLEVDRIAEFNGDFDLDEFDRQNLRMYLRGKTGTWAIAPLTSKSIIGQLDFVATNDQGPNYHLQAWKVKLTPKGNLGLISDDWGKYGFNFAVEDDTANHPTSPYGLLTLMHQS